MLDTTLSPLMQSKLIGHQPQWEMLTAQFAENKLHPAWLLTGQKGIGKATYAYQVARHILKTGQSNDRFIDNLISQKSHPNLLVIEKKIDEDGKLENEISIDSVRKIADFVHQSAAFPGWRIIIIDAIEELNRNAANALLKILEEPPKDVLILLVCHSIGKILPTIRSRCCLLPFSPLLEGELKAYSTEENESLALGLARGSIGKLMELQKVPLVKLAQDLAKNIEAALESRLSSIQQFVAGFEKGNPTGPIVIELLNWIAYNLVLLSQGVIVKEADEIGLSALVAKRSGQHWIKVQENLTLFVSNTEGAHLDVPTVLLACFLLFENPHHVRELAS